MGDSPKYTTVKVGTKAHQLFKSACALRDNTQMQEVSGEALLALVRFWSYDLEGTFEEFVIRAAELELKEAEQQDELVEETL